MNASVRWPAILVTAFVFLAPTGLWVWSTGDPTNYFSNAVPDGQLLYVISRLVGLLALSLFWFQAMTALARGVPWLEGFSRIGPANHRRIGLTLFALMLAHALLFFAAVSMRSGYPAWGLLVPEFDAGFYKFYVALGIVALALLPLGLAAGYLRRRLQGARWLHRIWPVVFVLVLLHGLNIGTETRVGLMLYVYLLMAASVVVTGLMRIFAEVRGRGPAASAAARAGRCNA